MKCNRCGSELQENDKVCSKCGWDVNRPPLPKFVVQADKLLRNRKSLFLIIALLAIGAFVFWKVSNVNSSPEKVMQAFMNGIYKENAGTVIRCIAGDTNGLNKSDVKNSLGSFNEQLKVQSENKSWIKQFKVTGVKQLTEKEFLDKAEKDNPMGLSQDAFKKMYNDKVRYYSMVTCRIEGKEKGDVVEFDIPVIKDKESGKYYITRYMAYTMLGLGLDDLEEEVSYIMQ